jgi:hypothetical protein
MAPILNWPLPQVPVIIGWYIDEPYGLVMPANVWRKPVAEIDGKIKRYRPRDKQGWSEAFLDMINHGSDAGKTVSMRFWLEMAELNELSILMADTDSEDEMVIKLKETEDEMMTRYGNPEVMIMTGELSNIISLLQFQTTWNNWLEHNENFMPLQGSIFASILMSLSDFNARPFARIKLKESLERYMKEDEDGVKLIEGFSPEHINLMSLVITRL